MRNENNTQEVIEPSNIQGVRIIRENNNLKIENTKLSLTKIIEKVDIASQDYAENAELATSALITTAMAFGGLATFAWEKIAKALKMKTSSIPAAIGLLGVVLVSASTASIQKQAARVGRFKIKQELMKHPEQLVYVSDEKTGEITDVEIKTEVDE